MKQVFGLMLMMTLLLSGPGSACAAMKEENPGTLKKIVRVQSRGLINVVSILLEPVTVFVTERRLHPKAWPVTYPFRFMTYGLYRLSSGANDFFLLPFAAPFTDDVRPLTAHMGLPDYSWQELQDV